MEDISTAYILCLRCTLSEKLMIIPTLIEISAIH